MSRPYILITPEVPDFIRDGLNETFQTRLYSKDSTIGEDDYPVGCLVSVEEWPLPNEILEKLSDRSVLIWNPGGLNVDDKPGKNLIVGQLYDNSQYDSLVIKLFSTGLYSKNKLENSQKVMGRMREVNRELLKVGIALSAERDNDKLLDLIVQQIRQLTGADAGSLYLLQENEDNQEKTLLFKIAHNDSNPTDFSEFSMPLDTASIAGYVAVTGEVLDIPDVYNLDEHGKIKFNKSYDEATGYRSKSILTVPMADHQGHIIGVIQLINKKIDWNVKLKTPEDVEKQVVEFDKQNESIVLSLASQAAVSLENNRLYNEIQTLFEGFVRASVKAIESRDPTTSGHSNRVAMLTVKLAEAVSREKKGEFANVNFSREEMLELRYASLLHDFGKVGVREAVLVKAKKLYPGQMDVIISRLHQISALICRDNLKKRLEYLRVEGPEKYEARVDEFLAEQNKQLEELRDFLENVEAANEPRFLEGETAHVLEEMGSSSFIDCEGIERTYLTPEELHLLSIGRGSLNPDERKEIESHVVHSYEFLSQIPWSRDMRNVPEISKSHHEVLTGTGYPEGLKGDAIPLQSQLMTIADIFDALTASDRPYKKAMPRDRAVSILQEEAEAGKINPELLRIFIENGIHELEA